MSELAYSSEFHKGAGRDHPATTSDSLLRYPKTLGDLDANPAWIQFAFFERKSPKVSTVGDKIHLYMPEQVAQPSTVSWDAENFGFIGNALRTGAANVVNAYKQKDIGALVAGATKQAENVIIGGVDLMTARGLANIGSMAVGLMGGNVSAEGLMGEIGGKVPNPYLTMIFRGINFRDFAFSFKFFPHSEDDCKTIDDIIKSFRANSLPNYEGAGDVFLGYPMECEISYMWENNRNPWLHRFKRAVCTGIDVDYTSSGMFSTMRNGFPSEIVLTTKWSEIDLVTRKDVYSNGEDGGY